MVTVVCLVFLCVSVFCFVWSSQDWCGMIVGGYNDDYDTTSFQAKAKHLPSTKWKSKKRHLSLSLSLSFGSLTKETHFARYTHICMFFFVEWLKQNNKKKTSQTSHDFSLDWFPIVFVFFFVDVVVWSSLYSWWLSSRSIVIWMWELY